VRALLRIAVVGVLVGFAVSACESRPPVDVWGHKNSTSKGVSVGVPF
jgi:hypothetical protein